MLPEQTRVWYEHYYKEKGKYRNDLLQNPEVLFQTLAYLDFGKLECRLTMS